MALPLTYHTKANSSTLGKKHIYLSGHPEDLTQHWGYICSLIFETCNCVVSHLDVKLLPNLQITKDELQFLLKNANGVFVVITQRYLKESSISSQTELPYLIDQHIPFLPLFLEPNLENTFTQRFQARHGISTASVDSTGIPFQHKIRTFLTNALGTAEENEQIHSAFQHRIFLSYRKKDRLRANAMIRQLHDDPRLDNTAIWFDEFLDPGTDFNEAIVQKIRDAELVLFVVTDSWLEKDNYIERIEYKETIQMGKPFFAVKFGHIDNGLLEKQYPGISTRFIPFSALLKKVGNALRLPRSIEIDSAHDLYLLSLAYIRGYYVAINRDKGRRLLEAAARKKDLDAINTLAEYLNTGFFGTADSETALKLYSESLSIHKRMLSRSADDEQISALFRCWDQIIKLYHSMGDEQSYIEETQKRLSFMEDYLHKRPSFQLAVLLVALYSDYGDHCLDLYETETARMYYTKIDNILDFIKNTPNLLYDPSDSDENNYDRHVWFEWIHLIKPYNRGLLANDAQDYELACTLFTQVEQEIKALDKLAHTAMFRSLLGSVYKYLGLIQFKKQQHQNAISYLNKSLKLVLLSIQEDPSQREDYLLAAEIQRYQCAALLDSGKLKKAELKLLELVKACEKNEQKWNDDVSFNRETAQAMFLLAQVYQRKRQWLLAEKYYHDAFNQITTRKYKVYTDQDMPILSLILHVSIDMHLMIVEETVVEAPNDDNYSILFQRFTSIRECIDVMHRLSIQPETEQLVRICRKFSQIGTSYHEQSCFTLAGNFLHGVLCVIHDHPDSDWTPELASIWIDTALKDHEVEMHSNSKFSPFFISHFTFEMVQKHPELLQIPNCVKLLCQSFINYAQMQQDCFSSERSSYEVCYAYLCAGLYVLEKYRAFLTPSEYLSGKLNVSVFSLSCTSLPVRFLMKEAMQAARTLSSLEENRDWTEITEKLEHLSTRPLFMSKLFFKKKALMGLPGIFNAGFRKVDLAKFILRL